MSLPPSRLPIPRVQVTPCLDGRSSRAHHPPLGVVPSSRSHPIRSRSPLSNGVSTSCHVRVTMSRLDRPPLCQDPTVLPHTTLLALASVALPLGGWGIRREEVVGPCGTLPRTSATTHAPRGLHSMWRPRIQALQTRTKSTTLPQEPRPRGSSPPRGFLDTAANEFEVFDAGVTRVLVTRATARTSSTPRRRSCQLHVMAPSAIPILSSRASYPIWPIG